MKTVESDYVIIGGGVIGLAIAYELAQRQHQVTVVDNKRVGQQTSWCAAGILPPVPMGSEYVVEYEKCGGLHVARGSGELASLKAAASLWKQDGIQVDLLSENDWTQIEPALAEAVRAGRIQGGVYTPGECVVRPPRLLKALAEACRRSGVRIEEEVEIDAWQQSPDKIESFTTAGSTPKCFMAAKFCCASGAWSTGFTRTFGLDLEVQPWRGQMLLLQSQPNLIRHVINEGPNYLVPRQDGKILVGSTVEEVGFDDANTEGVMEELRIFAGEMVPELKEAPKIAQWAGLRPGTGDGWPILGKAAERKNLFVATGHFRSGIFLAPATAHVMAQLMCDETTNYNLELFSVNRN
jgi:glycine oxidase